MNERLWTVDDCAEYLRRSASWVYHACGRGELPHRKIGGRLVFAPDSIRAWLERQPGTDLSSALRPRHREAERILTQPFQPAHDVRPPSYADKRQTCALTAQEPPKGA